MDWHTRDRQLAALVARVGQELLSHPGRPLRITKNRICNSAGLYLSAIEAQKDKLPLTVEALNNWTESPAECSIRRLRWAAAKLQNEGLPVSRNRLLRLSGIHRQPDETLSAKVERLLQSEPQ